MVARADSSTHLASQIEAIRLSRAVAEVDAGMFFLLFPFPFRPESMPSPPNHSVLRGASIAALPSTLVLWGA